MKKRKINKVKKISYCVSAVLIVCILIMTTSMYINRNTQKSNTQNNIDNETDNTTDNTTDSTTEENVAASGDTITDDIPLEISDEEILNTQVSQILNEMTLSQKICQMMIVTPEQLTGYETVTSAGEQTKSSIEKYPVGGILYFSKNLVSPEQTKEMLHNTQAYSYEVEGLPMFLCIDEEGGRVTRIASNTPFSVEKVGPMGGITTKEQANDAGTTIGEYLSAYGFNVDFAPDADVITNSANKAIGDRSFGKDGDTVTELAVAYSDGLHSKNMLSAFKHFPGHGATEADTHEGYAYTNRTYDELMNEELKPFRKASENNVDFVMVSHISVPNIIGDDTPSSLSEKMISEVLRKDIGYDGLIITDAMNMEAITKHYSLKEACVLAIKAGNDMLLMPSNVNEAYIAILEAVEQGVIDEKRVDESVSRIIKTKIKMDKNINGNNSSFLTGETYNEMDVQPIFEAQMLSNEDIAYMTNKSYDPTTSISTDDLRLLTLSYIDFDGESQVGQMVVNKVVADEVLAIFKELYEMKFPIEKMELIDVYDGDDDKSMEANNTSAYNHRFVSGTNRLSNHALGVAIDINPFTNPYVTASAVSPIGAEAYLDRTVSYQGGITKNSACYNAFISRGWVWGGNWNSVKDYQHFEKPKALD